MLHHWLHPILAHRGLITPIQSLIEKREARRCSGLKEARLLSPLETGKAFSEAQASRPLADSPWEPGLGCVDREGVVSSSVSHLHTSRMEGLSQWNSSAHTSTGS